MSCRIIVDNLYVSEDTKVKMRRRKNGKKNIRNMHMVL